MTGEAARIQKAGHSGCLADECVVIWGHLVHADPPVRDPDVEEGGGSSLHGAHQIGQPGLAVVPRESGRLVLERHPEQDPWTLAMEVEGGRGIDSHGRVVGDQMGEWFAHRLGDQDLSTQRFDRQVDAGHGTDLSGPSPGSADDGVGAHRAVVGHD